MHTFDPQEVTAFVYNDFTLDIEQGHLGLSYKFEGASHTFVEAISLPVASGNVNAKAAQRLARLVFLAAGLSYYKAAAPQTIVVQPAITAQEKTFLTELIRGGLTEFAYVNNLPQALTPVIEVTLQPAQPVVLPVNPTARLVVAIGGGKDSIVTLEALRAVGHQPLLFSVNSYEPIQKTVDQSGLPYIQVGRKISPALLQLNQRGAYNGHVPVTAINSLLALLAAVLTGNRTAVFSNERSASEGNTRWQGVEVNHQWSKSIAFERLLQTTLRHVVSPDLQYFSLLRPFSELRIARQFATLKQYHQVFTSCNRAFHLDPTKRQLWCANCPKCRFVFLILAPYLSKNELLAIFGKDLLDDGQQLAGFRELLGIEGHKPLECVGELVETRLALQLLEHNTEWQDSALVRVLLDNIAPEDMPTPAQRQEVFATGEHVVPAEFLAALEVIT